MVTVGWNPSTMRVLTNSDSGLVCTSCCGDTLPCTGNDVSALHVVVAGVVNCAGSVDVNDTYTVPFGIQGYRFDDSARTVIICTNCAEDSLGLVGATVQGGGFKFFNEFPGGAGGLIKKFGVSAAAFVTNFIGESGSGFVCNSFPDIQTCAGDIEDVFLAGENGTVTVSGVPGV